MRKCGVNFLQKVIAVLISAVLCVGLIAGAGSLDIWAAEGTKTARFKITILGYDGTDDMILQIAFFNRDNTQEWPVSVSVEEGVITYEVTGLQRNERYKWTIINDGGTQSYSFGFGEDDIHTWEATYCYVWLKDGDTLLETRCIPIKTMLTRPVSPKKEGYTFDGWVTEKGGESIFDFNQNITEPTSIYASWINNSVGVSQRVFRDKVREIVKNMTVANTTTRESFGNEIKNAVDKLFNIDSMVDVTEFSLVKATGESAGTLKFNFMVEYDNYFSVMGGTMPIDKLIPEQDRKWTLDDFGNLTIDSQSGMDDWVQNGRVEGNLSDVKNVVICDGVTEIPDNAFSGCGNLGSVTIPNTVTGIGNSAFAGASSLDEVTLPPALQNVGDGAFSGCGSLGKVVMQGTVPPAFMGDAVFDGCKFVTDSANTEGILVPPGSEDAYKNAGDVFGEYIKVEKPEVTEEALNGKLQEIFGTLTVSNDTTQDAVKEAVKKAIDEYFHIDSVIMIADFEILGEATAESEGSLRLAVTAKYGANSAQAEGTIPIAKLPPLPDRGWTMDEAGNLIIGSQAGMEDWTLHGRAEGKFPAVKSVLIQNGVTDILDDAFSGCCDLGTIVIPDTVTSIGSLAFKHASSLSEITLPPNLQSIGNSAFSDCSSLEKVVMQGATPPSMNASSAFERSKFVMDNTKGIVVPQNSEDAYKAALGTLGNNILEKHTHSFGSDWIHDEDNHWHECSCGGKGSVMPHIWSDGVVITPPTETEVGIMGYVCPECLATKTELIPATGGNPSVSGNDNPGGNPSVSGNDNPGGNPSVSGNDNPGGTPSVSGNGSSDDSPSGGNPGGGTSVPGNGNSEEDSLVGSGGLQQSGNSNDLALFWSAFNANTSKDTEPRTADGAPLELYATIAMIAGFFYLLLLFLEKYDITEEKRRESLARLVKWARRGGWPRKLPVMAALLLMRSYYRIVGGQSSKGKKI